MAKHPQTLPLLAVVLTIATAAFTISSAVDYHVTNNAIGRPGGARFDSDIGLYFTKQVLVNASSFISATFAGVVKNVQLITCSIEDITGVAFSGGNTIRVNSNYIESFLGDVRREITGVLYHEATHIWQWGGQGQAPLGLVEGVADYVRLKAGYERIGRWAKPGEGDRWDQGYDVTARFLDYCGGLTDGFVEKLNAKMKNGYSDDFFVELLGKQPNQLFKEYKAAHARLQAYN